MAILATVACGKWPLDETVVPGARRLSVRNRGGRMPEEPFGPWQRPGSRQRPQLRCCSFGDKEEYAESPNPDSYPWQKRTVGASAK